MFTKLLKHEFRTTARLLGVLSLAALLVGVLGFIFTLTATLNKNLQDHPLFVLLFLPVFMLIFFSLVGYGIASVFIPYKQFYQKKFTDEGYLTFTLPVTSHQILLSSILNSIIWNVISFFVIIITVLLIFSPMISQSMHEISGLFQLFSTDEFDALYSTGERIIDSLVGISAIPYSILLPFVSITLGSLLAKKRKVGMAFCIGYGISMIVSFFVNYLSIFKYTSESMTLIYVSGIITIMLYLSLSVVGYFVMHHLIRKKLNI